MENKLTFLLHQIVRFGAMTVPQIELLSPPRKSRSTTYKRLKLLMKQDLIERIGHPRSVVHGFTATKAGEALALGTEIASKLPSIRAQDFSHTLACADAFLKLASFENIKGIASEREMTPEFLSKFCYKKHPDGMFQIRKNDFISDIALEVENQPKTDSRIKEIISLYKITLEQNFLCKGVLIVAGTDSQRKKYISLIHEIAPLFIDYFQVVKRDELKTLPKSICGNFDASRLYQRGNAVEFRWNDSTGRISYEPIFSNSYDLNDHPKRDISMGSVKMSQDLSLTTGDGL